MNPWDIIGWIILAGMAYFAVAAVIYLICNAGNR